MRPTGALHVGHLAGALRNWAALQETHDCFFMVADWHALMSEYEHPDRLGEFAVSNVTDWLACGIDPKRSVIFRQSDVPEHLELYAVLSMITPLGWVERVPTYKEQLREVAGRDLATYGFLGYPVLQAADILLYKAGVVPVGEDQVPHLELAREIVRRFKFLYRRDLFPEPQPLLTEAPRLAGTDGRKMSKSYGNTIGLADDEATIRATVQQMVTDTQRIRMTDPGHPETCFVCQYWKVFAPGRAPQVWEECRTSQRGCAQNKRELADVLIEVTAPMRRARAAGGYSEAAVRAILQDGAERARAVARATMRQVREAVGLA
ncbi:MAG: tryptophan--tRNA ligase [Candidatus Omnitrophica bacterium]|nr:tryptophan--tRNA ligase [Candidatus Omnitrophota bacterium]